MFDAARKPLAAFWQRAGLAQERDRYGREPGALAQQGRNVIARACARAGRPARLRTFGLKSMARIAAPSAAIVSRKGADSA